MNELIQKTETLLNSCKEVVLATIDKNGYPRPCVVSVMKTNGLKEIYFATNLDSVKTTNIQANAKTGVCIWKEHDSTTITGTTEVITDQAVKSEIWQDWLVNHWPNGETDPNYCILKFTGEEAVLWVEQE